MLRKLGEGERTSPFGLEKLVTDLIDLSQALSVVSLSAWTWMIPTRRRLSRSVARIRCTGQGLPANQFELVLFCSDRIATRDLAQVVRSVERYKHDAMVEASVLDELAQLDAKADCQCVRLLDRGEAYGHYILAFEVQLTPAHPLILSVCEH